ncbi:MAG: hypothetical protein M1828_007654 [Chrysothrix sp. TS-e1954]|nr:MAG: hypothetical protein M1828_007654 [Chrysothrix sp. TS-e1954]
MGVVEALYIFNERNTIILEHVYTGRPPSASIVLPRFLSHPAPQPPFIHLPNTSPPVVVFSIIQDGLLFLVPSSTATEPLLVLEFIHRVADALEDFLGSPLLASKIESSYDVVVQIVGEMCDAGVVCNTEPNALREVVEVPNWMNSLLGGFGLPSTPPALGQRPNSPFSGGISNTNTSSAGSALPWRRSNVKHTSNELYVDIVESLQVVLAPSGRPISAFANGTIAFTAKISGVPDLLLSLTGPGGRSSMRHTMALPCFHPCVRLARWKEHPGELSFVPPDGRFVLAGYECDLLPDLFSSDAMNGKIPSPNLVLPATIEVNGSLGREGNELEVRLLMSSKNLTGASSMTTSNVARNSPFGGLSSGSASGSTTSTTGVPALEDVLIHVPISPEVRNVTGIRSTKGDAKFLPTEALLEWRISTREASGITNTGATLRCTLVGPVDEADDMTNGTKGLSLTTNIYDYDDTIDGSYQGLDGHASNNHAPGQSQTGARPDVTRVEKNATLMPQAATLSFKTRGWLASGIKVDSLTINAKSSKGLGAGVTPYKGVKYHTVSRQGIEVRC